MRKRIENLHKKWRYYIIYGIFIVLLMGIISLFIINKATGVKEALTNSHILSNIYYTTQIVTSIAVVFGGIIGIWQYSLTAKAERIKMSVERIQKAIDLAEYYKNNILNNFRVIDFVFIESGLMEIINKIDKEKICLFDRNELSRFLNQNDMDQIEKIRNSDKLIQAVLEADEIYGLDLDISKIQSVRIDTEKNVIEVSVNKTIIINKFLSNIVIETLNNLEFFAMHFSHEIADESVVYQSLHQTYLDIIYVLYYNIAIANQIENSKYFTNVIELYEQWKARDKSDMDQKLQMAREYSHKGSTAEKIVS